MKTNETPQANPQQPETIETLTHTAPPVTPASDKPEPDMTTPPSPPKLTLWELMRKDVPPEPDNDDTDRVLANPRNSIWDLE